MERRDKSRREMIAWSRFLFILFHSHSGLREQNDRLQPGDQDPVPPPPPWALLAVRSFLYETLLFMRRLQIVVFVTQMKKKPTSKHESAEGCRRGFGNRRMIWRGGSQLSQELTREFFLRQFEMRPRSSGSTSPSSQSPANDGGRFLS